MDGKKYIMAWIAAHMLALAGLLIALSAINGCTKKITEINMPPYAKQINQDSTVVGKIDYIEGQRFAPAAKRNSEIIYFDFDSDKLLPQEAMKLDYLIGRTGILRIEGHACTIGTNEYNIGLGLARAERVREYLGRGDVTSWGEEKCMAACKNIDDIDCKHCRMVEVIQ